MVSGPPSRVIRSVARLLQMHLTESDAFSERLRGASDRLLTYKITQPSPSAKVLAAIVLKQTEELRIAVSMLGKNGKLLEHCVEVNRLENEADLIGRSAVADLFHKEKDAIALIKLKEVYEFFEATIDSCEDVADVLQNVVVKNS